MRITSTDAQNNFGKYLRIASDLEEVVITKNGKDIVKLITCNEPLAGGPAERVSEEAVNYLYNHQNRMSYADFIEMTEKSDLRYELIDGEVYLLSSPAYGHQIAVSAFLYGFMQWFQDKPCRVLTAPFDVTLNLSEQNINVVQPDVMVLCDPERVNEKGRYEGVPSLVVEVLSSSTRRKDMLKKLDLYLRTGIREYWLVDPDARQIMVYFFEEADIKEYRALGSEGHVGSMLFPGLVIDAGKVFR